jgi:hypothetical protein
MEVHTETSDMQVEVGLCLSRSNLHQMIDNIGVGQLLRMEADSAHRSAMQPGYVFLHQGCSMLDQVFVVPEIDSFKFSLCS